MARQYGRVLCSIWSDDDFLVLTMPARLLYLALISQPDVSPAGVMPITVGRWRAYLSPVATRDDVWATLHDLGAARFVLVDETAEELWIRTFMRHDGRLSNPKLRSSISTALAEIRSPVLRAAAATEFTAITPGATPNDGRSDAVPMPIDSARAPGSQQPAAGSLKPEAGSRSRADHGRQPDADPPSAMGEAAAAAREILITHRLTTEPSVRSPAKYAARIRDAVAVSHGQWLAGFAADADPVAIAVAVFGLTRDQAITADYHRRNASPL